MSTEESDNALRSEIPKRQRRIKEEMTKRKIRVLPQTLCEALDELERDEVIQAGLGPIYPEFLRLKRIEWNDYHRDVSAWEVERYLTHEGIG